MKINFKRVATTAVAVAMSLSLAAPAFAEGNGDGKTLTVTGDTLDNKKVYAVQMFTAHATGTDSVVFDNYELADQNWLAFFRAPTAEGGLNKPEADADAAREYVETLTGKNLVTFADQAQAWVRGHAGAFEVITSDGEDPAVADKETFSNLKPGYYLVYPEGGSTGTENRVTDAMLVNVPQDKNAVWNIKSTFPTVDKKVDTDNEGAGAAGDNGSAQVGDIVTFTLKSKVPDMSDYDEFYFAFIDTLSKGLEFVEKTPGDSGVDANDVTVTIGGKTVTAGYSVSLNDKDLKIVFTDLKNDVTVTDGAVTTGAEIVVTYQAMITEAAATTPNPVTNTVEVEYSNDPSSDGHGTSTPDESKVYTYDIDVNKWAVGPDGEKGTQDDIVNLPDAKFVLSTSDTLGNVESDANVVKLIANGADAYRVAKPNEEGAATSFTTTANDDINISGLKAGTYYLHEIEAPEGYNKLKKPVKIEIVVEGENYEHATIEVNDKAATGADGNVIDVENKKGIELPETGSIGTIGLTALGVVVVVAGLFAFPRKKKTRQD